MKKKFSIFIMAICMILPAMFALTACGHSHEFSNVWLNDADYHWHACTGENCNETTDNSAHTFVKKTNDENHWQECNVCEYKKDETAHVFVTKHNDDKHWQECDCGYKKDEAVHTLITKNSGDKHWQECACGYSTAETAHVLVTKHNDDKHWQECDCGYKTEEIAHTFETDYDSENHWKKCACGQTKDVTPHDFKVNNIYITADYHILGCNDSECEYVSGELEHTYEEDSQMTCDNCSHDRDEATLAFKSGTYAITYDGLAHAFDKATLAEVEYANLNEVVVEYKLSGSADWTTEAPVNAGSYSIRLSVPATKDHTSAEATQEFVISPIMLDMSNFVRVYTYEEAISGSNTFDVTSADIAEILPSETLKITIFRRTVNITEGTCYNFKSTASAESSDDFAAQILDNKNYQISGSTSGKLYVTKSATSSGSGTSTSPYTYTAEATIAKDGIVYYIAKPVRTRTGTDNEFAVNFDVTLSDSDARIVDVYTKSNSFTVKLANDGTLVTYGIATSSPMAIYFAVEYKGESESKKVTLTLTQSYAKTTVDSENWSSAFNIENEAKLHATLKEDGSIIEESKIDKDNKKYYQNNNGTEVYYSRYLTENSFIKYAKNKDDKWARELTFKDASSIDEANAKAFNATKFSSALINALATSGDFEFTNNDQMYHLNSYELSEATYTNIALKFKDNKLVYVEYELNEKKYTIEFEYGTPQIDVPTDCVGMYQNNPIKVSFIRTTKKFTSTEIIVGANLYTYCEFEITDTVISAYGGSTLGKCNVTGAFTTEVSDAEIIIRVYNSENTEVTNSLISSKDGKLQLSNLTKGKYTIRIHSNTNCTGSLNIEKYEMTSSS